MNLKYLFIYICCIALLNCAKVQNKDKINTINTESLYVDLEGNAINLKELQGRRILLNFWATWCTPCLKEMPSMARAQEALENENYVFLFATTDNLETIHQFKKKTNYPFHFIQFKGTLDKLNIHALPATFIYNTKGKKVKRIDGATDWASEELLNQLRAVQ